MIFKPFFFENPKIEKEKEKERRVCTPTYNCIHPRVDYDLEYSLSRRRFVK